MNKPQLEPHETQVSGCIVSTPSPHQKYGKEYCIRPNGEYGWGIPTRDITPNDLRAMADDMEGFNPVLDLIESVLEGVTALKDDSNDPALRAVYTANATIVHELKEEIIKLQSNG